MTDETRARFLAAIAAQLPAERIAEVHLFPAIRQGGMESGVAVVAVEREEPALLDEPALRDEPPLLDESGEGATPSEPTGGPESVESGESAQALDGAWSDSAAELSTVPSPPAVPRRYTVYSARYRHTLKGPERGKWEVNVTEEADAPLLTVDAVVRGVQRRSGDAEEIVRLSGDEVRGMVETVGR